jgi:hypothetical protein
MQQDCRSVTLVSPLVLFHRGSYSNNSPGTFQYHLVLLFLAHSFAFDIKASLVTGNPFFVNLWNTLEQRHQSQDFFLSLVQEKALYFSDMKTVLFLFFANDVYMPHLLFSSYELRDWAFYAGNPIFQEPLIG